MHYSLDTGALVKTVSMVTIVNTTLTNVTTTNVEIMACVIIPLDHTSVTVQVLVSMETDVKLT